MNAELIVSLSRIGEPTLAAVAQFCDDLAARRVPASLLVAPRLKGGYRLETDPETIDWLAARRADGDALVLHGYDEAATKRRRSEFATLPAHEAHLRLIGAGRGPERAALRARPFAPPGWAASAGSR